MEAVRGSFWLPTAAAVTGGIVSGFGFTSVHALVDLRFGLFGFSDQASARAVLQTIATATVSVAGLSFSVTLVALTLAAQQLSPRVLRTFRTDRVAQFTLAAFLGTFAYSLMVLARLGADSGPQVPEFAVTLAIVFALGSVGMFVAFIGDIVLALQASTVIRRIATDAQQAIDGRSPRGIGQGHDDRGHAGFVEAITSREDGIAVRATSHGYLTHLDHRIVELASDRDLFVQQRMPVGEYVVRGQTVAVAWPQASEDPPVADLAECFVLAPERTFAADPAFPVRQLADIALRALSPGVNDPTTAENAMSALTDVLVRFADDDAISPVRTDEAGQPRFCALVADFDDLVQVGFEEVLEAAKGQPAIERRLEVLLEALRLPPSHRLAPT